MSGGIRIARIFGIPIYLHPTWFIVFLLVTLGLSSGLEGEYPGWSPALRRTLAGATSLLFFGSILLHELGHSVIALRHSVPVRSITLFFFGGVAVMEREPESARAEFQIAIAGPLVSAFLALGFVLLERVSGPELTFVFGWLTRINFIVAVFNLLPGFPLDGGRILRAVLWARNGDIVESTRISAGIGRLIAYGFIGVGLLEVFGLSLLGIVGGGVAGGVWFACIGWFLLMASGASLRQATVDQAVQGLEARHVMMGGLCRIDAGTSVAEFAREFVMAGRPWALVERFGGVVGIITRSDVRRVAPDEWERVRVDQVATPVDRMVVAAPDTPVQTLLQNMGRRQIDQVPVVEEGRVVGAVTREWLVHSLETRQAR